MLLQRVEGAGEREGRVRRLATASPLAVSPRRLETAGRRRVRRRRRMTHRSSACACRPGERGGGRREQGGAVEGKGLLLALVATLRACPPPVAALALRAAAGSGPLVRTSRRAHATSLIARDRPSLCRALSLFLALRSALGLVQYVVGVEQKRRPDLVPVPPLSHSTLEPRRRLARPLPRSLLSRFSDEPATNLWTTSSRSPPEWRDRPPPRLSLAGSPESSSRRAHVGEIWT